jgi:hypothetical protein
MHKKKLFAGHTIFGFILVKVIFFKEKWTRIESQYSVPCLVKLHHHYHHRRQYQSPQRPFAGSKEEERVAVEK